MKHSKLTPLILSIVASIILHFYLMFKKIENTEIKQQKKQEQNHSANNGGDKDKDTTQKIWFKRSAIPCDSYEGIGLQFMLLTGIVTYVAPDSPAWKAGLRTGDELITPIWNMDLKFGQQVEIIAKRDNTNLKFNVFVDRICKDENN
jgi:C-terminal processing protease CtpA/Prc